MKEMRGFNVEVEGTLCKSLRECELRSEGSRELLLGLEVKSGLRDEGSLKGS